jgi:hypothetical protein
MKMTKPHIKEMMKYVKVVPNIVPDELCDALIGEYTHSPLWEQARVGGAPGHGELSPHRNCSVLSLDENKIHKNWKALDDAMFECSLNAINIYRDEFPECNIEEDSGYEMLRYTKGGYYRQHTDSFCKIMRSISCSFALNENFKGGEWLFFDGQIKMRVNKGEAVMFPSNFMFPHAINTVEAGTRYSIITWFR